MNISYDYYRTFYYVAKYKSITQAAAVMLNNQPNVTRTIKNLEKELGCILFTRSRQGVQLTAEGEKLFEHISIAFEHIKAGEEELAIDKTLKSGTVSISASEIALHCFLLPILKDFRQLYPGVCLRISNHSTPQALSAVKNGLADIAVVTTPVEIPHYLKCTVVKEISEIAVCGTTFYDVKKEKLKLSEIAQMPIICLGKHTQTYAFYSDWFLKNGLPFSPIVEAATADQILPFVVNNLGIGFVPKAFADNFEPKKAIRILELEKPIPKRSICYIKRTGFTLSIAAKKLEEMIKLNVEIKNNR